MTQVRDQEALANRVHELFGDGCNGARFKKLVKANLYQYQREGACFASVIKALHHFDEIYPQPNGQSTLQQLQIQLAKPMPYDLEDTRLNEYKDLIPKWHNWTNVETVAGRIAELLLEHL